MRSGRHKHMRIRIRYMGGRPCTLVDHMIFQYYMYVEKLGVAWGRGYRYQLPMVKAISVV